MTFSKKLMLERLSEEGRADDIDRKMFDIMDDLDGQHVSTYCWRHVVNEENVGWCIAKSGEGYYVNLDDCVL